MDTIDALEQAWAQGAKYVTGVSGGQLAAATVCNGWDVRDLLNHTLGESMMFTAVNLEQVTSNDHGDVVSDGHDLLTTWTGIAQANVESWRASGLDGERTYFFGTFPAPASAIINLGEVIVHSWDLATATGQTATLDPEHVALVYGLYSHVPMDEMRANGVFGPEVAVPADASDTDRLLGLLGRQP